MSDGLDVTDPTRVPAATASSRSPWVTVGVVLAGTYAFVLNGHVTGIAIPAIAKDLGASSALGVDWVVTTFLVGVVLVLPVTGWLADRFGRRLVITYALGLFAVGCLICLAAPTLEILLVGRFFQGFGGGVLVPLGMASVYDLFPPGQRGKALGVWGFAMTVAPAAGPPVGGLVVAFAHWRWLFAGFFVVAIAATVLTFRLIDDVGHREPRRLDLVGWALAATGVASIVVGAREINTWGLVSVRTLIVVVLAAVTLPAFAIHTRRTSRPLVDFRMYRVPTFSIAMGVIAMVAVAQMARLHLVPVQLQVVRSLPPERVGLLLAPAAIGIAITMPIGGWLVDRVGARLPVTVGAGFAALGSLLIARIGPDDPVIDVVIAVLVQGIGNGLAIVPTTIAALNSLPRQFVSQASGVNELTRQLSGALGVAVLSAIIVGRLGSIAPSEADSVSTQAAYHDVFMIAFWVAVAAAALALLLPGPQRARAHRELRQAELAIVNGQT